MNQYPSDFLKRLDLQNNKTIYARITSLNFNEAPRETIEGKVSGGGSISVDGTSALRRTCSLTLLAEGTDITEYYWGLNTKFKLEIGVDNYIDSNYPERIWFKQGIYIITSFNCSLSTNNYSISITGKDKMCLLDGTVGGTIQYQADFASYDQIDENGNSENIKYPIEQIIRDAVHQYAGEPFHNIIIDNLGDGLELLEYRYDKPMYLIRRANSKDYFNYTMDGDKPCWYQKESWIKTTISDDENIQYDSLYSIANDIDSESTIIRFDNSGMNYCVAKIEYGQTAGYRTTELTYPGELIANVGDSLVSVLDKIKNMLGEFEYFYDLDGHFVFQKKQVYLYSNWSPIKTDEDKTTYYIDVLSSPIKYNFTNNELITAISNTPDLLKLRNDYSIWGARKSVDGSEIPIHLRYAIDKKPVSYTNFDNNSFTTPTYDWRELIYQMAQDYKKHNRDNDFALKIAENNKINGQSLYPTGRTGYEQYYIDLDGFWRQLYTPIQELTDKHNDAKDQFDEEFSLEIEFKETINSNSYNEIKNWFIAEETTESLAENITFDNKTMTMTLILGNRLSEKRNYLRDIWAIIKDKLYVTEKLISKEEYERVTKFLKDERAKLANIWKAIYGNWAYKDVPSGAKYYWSNTVVNTPENLNFWFDFLDTEGDLQKYACYNIGSRPKAVSESSVKSIFYRETPAIIFATSNEYREVGDGYKRFQIAAGFEDMFSISAQGQSAQNKLDEMLYNYAYCAESISITCIPIYYLEPNTRISVYDEETGINGEYTISRLTIPLTYNGTMSISAVKVPERFN